MSGKAFEIKLQYDHFVEFLCFNFFKKKQKLQVFVDEIKIISGQLGCQLHVVQLVANYDQGSYLPIGIEKN